MNRLSLQTFSCSFFFLFLSCNISATKVTSDSNKCPEDFVPDLNGKCVKRFVLPNRKQCPTPDLQFGGFELELDGRLAKFWCEEGWTLVPSTPGQHHAMCKIGQWDRPLPSCVRPGCDDVVPPDHGHFTYELDGALARFSCSGHRILVGDSVLGCDGQYWNATAPICELPTTTTTARPKTMRNVDASSSSSSTSSWTNLDLKMVVAVLAGLALLRVL